MKDKYIPPFRRFVIQNFPFIESDFESLDAYGLWCKVVEYLNKVIKSQNEVTAEMQQALDYINHYFDNLDVQEEINNKLDAMAESGELEELIAEYLNTKAIICFDNVAGMVASEALVAGSYAKTLGYYTKGDYGASTYKITDEDLTANGSTIIALDSGLFAVLNLDEKTIKAEQFGAYGDGENDDTDALQSAINYSIEHNLTLELNGQYKVTPKTLDDSTKVCLTYYKHSGLQECGTEIKFNRMAKIFTEDDTEGATLLRIEARNIRVVNGVFEGVQNKTHLVEFSRIIKTSTNYDGWNLDNIFESCIFRYGRNAISMEGYCFYNKFNNCRIFNCYNGIVLQMTAREKAGLEQSASVNRNYFVNTNMNIIGNWGIRVEYGDTNHFVNVDLEGCGNGIYIDEPLAHSGDFAIAPLWSNVSNTFVNVMMEVITTKEWYNRNPSTRIYGTTGNWGAKADMIVQPQFYQGGLDYTTSIEKMLAFVYNKDVTQYPSSTHWGMEANAPLATRGLYDYTVTSGDAVKMGFGSMTFDIASQDYVSNITSATQSLQCKSVGNIVYISGLVSDLVPVDTSSAVRLIFRDSRPWLQAREIVYKSQDIAVVLSGKKGGNNVVLHGVIKQNYIYVYPPEGGWNASNNAISVNVEYMRDGDL